MVRVDDYRDEATRLIAAGNSVRQVARDLELNYSSLVYAMRRWRVAHHADKPVLPDPERDRLRARIRQLEVEAVSVGELTRAIVDAANGARLPAARPRGTRPNVSGATPADVIFHVSDMQYGEIVHSGDVAGGAYSPELFRSARLPSWLGQAVGMLEAVSRSRRLGRVWIVAGGDFVEGHDVFKGQAWHLAMSAGEQVATLAPLWADAVAYLARRAKTLGARSVYVPCVVGNHGVQGGRSAGAVPPSLNYDYLTYEMTRHILSGASDNGCVDWHEDSPRKAVYLESMGHLFLVTHGDQDTGGGLVGAPVLSGLRNDLTVRQQTGVNHRYHLAGHFHRPTSVTVGGDSQRHWNGDWCGPNNLSVGRGGGSEPTQRAYVVTARSGVEQEWNFRLAPGTSRSALPIIGGGS